MNDVELAIAVAEEGAAVVRRCFGSTLHRLDKGGGDFATNADVEAEQAMLALLKRERPEDGILGEETGRTGSHASARTWLIDPLCGTLNYAAKMRVVAVNVALRTGNTFTAAAVADPFAGELYWTDRVQAGVRANGHSGALKPDASSNLVDLNLDPPFPNAPAFRATSLAEDAGFVARFRPRVVSTSLALAWVATGQRAAYVTDGDVRDSVHFAAGVAICEAAGCTVTDLRGQPWGSGATGLLAAADGKVHAALLELVRKYLRGGFTHRLATRADLAALERLMDVSIRTFIGAYLDAPRVDASFEFMGVDTQLIEDGTYFVVECENRIAGCGGWSRRATLFGGDHSNGRDARLLDPATEPARVRAMYTHPDFARRGVGRLVLSLCETAAAKEGFRSLELMATVAGEPLYRACGFTIVERIEVPTSKAVTVPGARMTKVINT